MPRQPRLLLSLSYYHVITRGNNLNNIFRKDKDYLQYFELITKYKKTHPFNIYHYCLMSNHTHLLIRTNKASDFSTFMKRLNLAYFYYFKRNYSWVGHFWQGRYKSQPVGKDEYFLQCGKYIEFNPLRAGIVEKPQDYPYSSYHHYANGVKDNLITEDMFYNELGKTDKERQSKYKDMMIDEIVEKTYDKLSWGSSKQRYNEQRKTRYNLKKIIKSKAS